MEVKKYNPFVVKTKPTGFTRERSSKTKPKIKPKPQTKLAARGLWRSMDGVLSLENKKKLDTIYAKGFVKTSRKQR